jgi:hypothetical protein
MPLINYIGNRQECLGDNAGSRRVQRGPAPTPPALSLDYLIVGGGASGLGTSNPGGSGGGVVSGSAVTMSFNSSIAIIVGAGGITDSRNGFSSSMSGSTFPFIGAGGATGNSGQPTEFSQGLDGPGTPPLPQGGGAGSSQNGQNGTLGVSGNGGNGSIWVNGLYYAGGGGGNGGGVAGLPGLGGGGTAQTGVGPDGLPYQLNGYNGRGGGAASSGTAGGSGSVIVRYTTGSLRMAQGGTQFESGGYFYHEFTGSGTLFYGY